MKKHLQQLLAGSVNAIKSIFGSRSAWIRRKAVTSAFVTDQGVMVSSVTPDGRFTSRMVKVGSDGSSGREPWWKTCNIDLQVSGQKLLLTVPSLAGQESVPFEINVGDTKENQRLLKQIQHQWLSFNQGSMTVATAGFVAPSLRASPRLPYAFAASILLVAGVGWYGANLYLRPGGPTMNLSSMSVEDIAKIDGNPVVVQALQSKMIEAVGAGQARAKEMNGQIEKNHMEALESMGLKAGVSMKNAMSCLSK